MAYDLIETSEGLFAVDLALVGRVLNDYAYGDSLRRHAKERTLSQRGLNPFSWGLPDVHTVYVDWDQVATQRRDTRAALENTYSRLIHRHYLNARLQESREHTRPLSHLREQLIGMERDAFRYKQEFRRKQNHAQHLTAMAVRSAVETYELGQSVAEFTRDASVTTLMVGAAVLTGGSATLALGLGSTVKGVGKYAETGNVAAGVMDFTVNFTLGLIPGAPKGATNLEKAALFVVTTKLELGMNTAVGMIDGKSFSDALQGAAVDLLVGKSLGKVMDGAAEKIFSVEEVRKEISKMTLAGVLRVTGTGTAQTIGAIAREKLVNSVSTKPVKPGATAGVLSGRVLVAEPSLAEMAILGPDQSRSERPAFEIRQRAPKARRRIGTTGLRD